WLVSTGERMVAVFVVVEDLGAEPLLFRPGERARFRRVHGLVAVEPQDLLDVVLDGQLVPLQQFLYAQADGLDEGIRGAGDRCLLVRLVDGVADRPGQVRPELLWKAIGDRDPPGESLDDAGR